MVGVCYLLNMCRLSIIWGKSPIYKILLRRRSLPITPNSLWSSTLSDVGPWTRLTLPSIKYLRIGKLLKIGSVSIRQNFAPSLQIKITNELLFLGRFQELRRVRLVRIREQRFKSLTDDQKSSQICCCTYQIKTSDTIPGSVCPTFWAIRFNLHLSDFE